MTASLRLFHHPLDASSRRVRLLLAEKNITCGLAIEKPWDPTDDLVALSPGGDLPVLVIEGKRGERLRGAPNESGKEVQHIIADAQAICEYLEEEQPTPPLMGKDKLGRAEVRRLVGWFDRKFQREVTDLIAGEKAFKKLTGFGEPDSLLIRTGYLNLRAHLEYISDLIEQRNWIAGDVLTLADLAAAAQLSVIDYMGDVPWDRHVMAKEWYARIKSRPSFRGVLGDHIAGFPPPRHYADLDF